MTNSATEQHLTGPVGAQGTRRRKREGGVARRRSDRSISPRPLGHRGTTPGSNLIYVHRERRVSKHALNGIYVTGPGHRSRGLVANANMVGTYRDVCRAASRDEAEPAR